MDYVVGGSAKTAYFRLAENSTPDGYDFLQSDGATAATLPAHAALNLTLSTSNKPTPSSDGLASIDHGNFQCNEALDTFIETMRADAAASSEVEEKMSDDGVKYGGGATAADKLLTGIVYGAVNATTSKMRITVVFGGVDGASGGGGAEANKMVAPTLKMNGSKNTYAVTIPKGLFDTAKIAEPAADVVIPTGKCWKTFWAALPA